MPAPIRADHESVTETLERDAQFELLIIRRATDFDAEAVARLYLLEASLEEQLGGYSLVAGFDWSSWVAARLRAQGHWMHVAQRGPAIVGFVHSRLRSLPKGSGSPDRGNCIRRAVRALRALGSRRSGSATPALPARFEGWGIIECLYVAESERRQGIAKRLVEAARNELAASGATRIEISVMVSNDAALAFWRKADFRPFRAHLVADLDRTRG